MILAAALLAASTVVPPGGVLSEQARVLIAPVHEAYAEAERNQALLPPPKTDAERLERLLDLDQAGRNQLQRLDFNVLPKQEREGAQAAMWAEIKAHDLADQRQLKAMIPAEGWFAKSKYGRKAADAAFLIVQHAVNDPELMKSTLKQMERLLPSGEVEGGQYALLYDRVSLEFENRPQRYGSQFRCEGGHMVVECLEAPEKVEQRRKAIGMPQSFADYAKMMQSFPCSG